MVMNLIELIDPIKIPPMPVQRARRDADMIKLAVWLIHSMVKHLRKTQLKDKWDFKNMHVTQHVRDWHAQYPEGFPPLSSDVWNMFSQNDLKVGIQNLKDPKIDAGYHPVWRQVSLNSLVLPELFSSQSSQIPHVVHALTHELRHAYDDLISKGKGLASDAAVTGISYSDYLSLPEEVRARFQQLIPDLIQELYFPDGAVKDVSYFKLIVPQLLQKHQLNVADLASQAQPQKLYQRLIKQAHLLKQSMDQLPQSERAQLISQLNQVKSLGPQPTQPWWRKIMQKLHM